MDLYYHQYTAATIRLQLYSHVHMCMGAKKIVLVRTLHTIRMCGKHTSRNINGKVMSHAMDNFCILAVRVHVLQVPRPSSPPCKGLVCVTINDTNYTQHLVLVYMYIYTAIICILRYNASVHFCKRWNSCCGVPHMHTYYHIHTFTSLSPPLSLPTPHTHARILTHTM